MKIAVVTGASSGMGKEFVRQIGQETSLDEIWVIARRQERLQKLQELTSMRVRPVALDLAQPEAVEDYKALLEQEQPQIQYLVNAAGKGVLGSFEEVSLKDTYDMIDVNIKAMVGMTAVSAPHMGRGSCVIQIGSSSSFQPLPYFNIYASTKAFVRHYARALEVELRPRGVRTTVMCPGWVETEFFYHTKDEQAGYVPKAYKPMASPEAVVAKALRDVKKGRALSVYGAFNKTQHILAKVLPQSLVMKTWRAMLKKTDGEK